MREWWEMMTTVEFFRAVGSGFGRIDPIAVVLSSLGVIGIMGWLVVQEIVRQTRRRRDEIQVGWRYFDEYADQKRLTPGESAALREVVRSGQVPSADLVFDSPFVFEEALEAFLAELKNRSRDDTFYSLLRSLRFKLGYAQLPPEVPLSSTRQFEEGLIAHWLLPGRRLPGTLDFVSERDWRLTVEGDWPEEIAPNQTLDIGILRPGDAEYQVQATLTALRPGSHTLVLAHTRRLERKQLRNWVRVEVNLPFRLSIVSAPPPSSTDDQILPPGLVLEGRLIDLSGGGACARLPTSIPKGHRISLNFDFPGSSFRGVRAEVMRIALNRKNGREDYEHHLKFLALETPQQERIVRYVFEKQRLETQGRAGQNPVQAAP